MTEVTLTSVLSSIGEVFESSIGWVGTVAETVAQEPLLLVGFVVGFIGLGVGLFKRLSNV